MRKGLNIKNMLEVLKSHMVGVSERIDVGSRVSKRQEHCSDFVVVSFPNRVLDNLAIGTTYCRIDLYAKDLQSGVENLSRLSQMQTEVYDRLPISDKEYIISNPQTIQMGRDTLGYHCVSIICNVIIL